MFVPFDHVTIGGMEFVLHYKHTDKPMIGLDYPEWHAIDIYGNEVVVREKEMVKLPAMAYDGDKRLFEPTFYRLTEDTFDRTNSIILSVCVATGVQSGSYYDTEGCQWHWNIPKLTINSNNQKCTLEVFSTGGWWI